MPKKKQVIQFIRNM